MPMQTTTPPAFDALVAYGMAGLVVVVAVLWVVVFSRGQLGRALMLSAGVAAVMAVSGLAAWTGLLQRNDLTPPPMAVMIALVFVMAFWAGLSPFGLASAREVPLVTLIGFQGFRLPLEDVVMHRAAVLGIMPAELSYSGYNFDIVTGIGAIVLAGLLGMGVRVPRAVLWAWNLWGCWCLAVIAGIAIASSPMLRLFGEAPHVNTWVLFVPYVWLPAVLVTAAIFGHIVITRTLLGR